MAVGTPPACSSDPVTVLELRSYRILPGMGERFAEHVTRVRLPIYARLGWRCDGFWIPEDRPDRAYYILRWTSLEERAHKRELLAADPEWTTWKSKNPEKLVDDFVSTLMTQIC